MIIYTKVLIFIIKIFVIKYRKVTLFLNAH